MKNLNFIFLIFFLIFYIEIFAQQDAVISGGNTVSSFVCANKKVYTWGAGSGNPSQVVFPGGIDIKQVNSGSGSTYVALDCNDAVWAWGNNKFGQVGNGSTSTTVASPTRVLASAGIAATNRNGSGQLTNVKVVYGGNNNSYAILNDGKLVAWGHNSSSGSGGSWDNNDGQLGDGTTTDQTSAVYVIDGTTGLPLTGVTQVFAGDNVTYALIGNTVYSWGNGLNGTLGRDATGTTNPISAATVVSSMAYPVRYADNTIMNNITAISAGDVFGIALDVNGYVWTWGNGAWNNSTGNSTTNYSGSDPRKVLKGSTVGASNDGTYLLAKSIGGGQGFGMAVSIDGKPVAWGGGGCNSGGATGNGTTSGSGTSGVGYVMRGAGVVDSNAISVSRGDLWGYYRTTNNDIYAWGCNSLGQLGIGNTTDQPYAVIMPPPPGCNLRDPEPSVHLKPRDTTVCASKFISLLLNSGFIPSAGLGASYQINWYKNNAIIFIGTADNALTYTATTAGKYTVEIKYTGSNGGCVVYPIAKDSMTISTFPITFTVPTNLTYCGNTANVNVNSTTTTNAVYDWFPTSSSTVSMATSIGSGSTLIDISGISAAPNGDKIIYVEEKSFASGSVFNKNQGKDPNWSGTDFLNSGNVNDNNQSGFTITEPLTIDSLTIHLQSDIYNSPGNYSALLNFQIFGSKTNNGGLVADSSNKIGAFSYNFNRNRTTDPQTKDSDVVVPVNIKIPSSGTYFISMINISGVSGNGGLKIGKGNTGGQTVPVGDNVTGNIIQFTNSSGTFSNPQTGANINQGYYFNIKFKTDQRYCDRLPVTLKKVCPCQQPVSATVNSTPAPVGKTVTVCPGTTIDLTGTYVAGSNPLTNTIQYVWYKKGSTPDAYTAIPVGSYSLTGVTADSGIWILRVEDGSAGNSSCYKEDSIKVVINPTLIVNAAKDTICSGSKANITLTTSGTSLTTFDWVASSANPNVSGFTTPGSASGSGSVIDDILINTGTTDGSVKYSVTPTSLGCTGATTDIDIVVKPIPTLTITSTNSTICGGNDPGIVVQTNIAGSTFDWIMQSTGLGPVALLGNNSGTNVTYGSFAAIINNTNTASGIASFTMTPNNNGCKGSDQTISISVNPSPDVKLITGNNSICSGNTTNYNFNTSITNMPVTFDWVSTSSNANISGFSATGSTSVLPLLISDVLTNTGNNIGTVTYTITPSGGGCTGQPLVVVDTIIPVLSLTVTSTNSTICGGNDAGIVVQSNIIGSTFDWKMQSSGAGLITMSGTNSGTNVTYGSFTAILNNTSNASGIATFTMTPSKNVCNAPSQTISISVNPSPDVKLISGNNSICSGNTTNLNFNTSITNMPVTFVWVATSSNANISGYTASGSSSTLPLLISDVLTNLGNNIGTVTYTITPSDGGCTGQPLVFMDTVKPIPVALVVNNNPQFCSGNTTSINISSSTTGTIFNVNAISTSGNIVGLISKSNLVSGTNISETLTANTTSTAQFTIAPIANGCPGTPVTENITVYQMPISDAGKDVSFCEDGSAKIGSTNNSDYLYSWTPYVDLSYNDISDPTTFSKKTTKYIITTSLKNYPACQKSDTVNVDVSPVFKVDAGLDILTCANELTTLTATPKGLSSYIWTDSISKKSYSGQNIPIQTSQTNKYYLVATNSAQGGCEARDSIIINIRNNTIPTLFIPNAFTPNANDLNDIFKVFGTGVEQFEAMIYNRWGEKLHTWNDINIGWDGTYKGHAVEEGVYVYVIRVKDICEGEFRDFRRGTVSVIK